MTIPLYDIAKLATAGLLSVALSAAPSAQAPTLWPDSIRVWGEFQCDTDGRRGRFERVAAFDNVTTVLRSDGRIFLNGSGISRIDMIPPAPAGQRYIDAEVTSSNGTGLLSSGHIIQWGPLPFLAPPALPPSTRYTQFSRGGSHALALRSDGAVVAWTSQAGSAIHGQATIPVQLLPGTVAKVSAGNQYSLALRNDGSIVAWGNNADGQCNVPVLPTGVTYVDVHAGSRHAVAIRSDGLVEAWGSNASGQCNVLPLPAGVTYVLAAGGWWHSSAYRSDGEFVTWGDQSLGQGGVPQIPPGDACVQLDSGQAHTVALLRSGKVLAWGSNELLQSVLPDEPQGPNPARFLAAAAGRNHIVGLNSRREIVAWGRDIHGITMVPPALQGRQWLDVGCGTLHTVALARGGSLHAWGDNSAGQCNVPPLPPQVYWTKFVVGPGHNVAMRSDGVTEGWGDNGWLCLPIPIPPPGLRYVEADCNYSTTLLLRSDNTLHHLGKPNSLAVPPPNAAPGERFVEVATTDNRFQAALMEDGTVIHWGVPSSYWQPLRPLPAPLPFGVSYVQIEALRYSMALRRSDGCIDMMGEPQVWVRALDPGTSYVGLSGGNDIVAARVGPTCTYVSFASGCAGSRPATRLIPRDTPDRKSVV